MIEFRTDRKKNMIGRMDFTIMHLVDAFIQRTYKVHFISICAPWEFALLVLCKQLCYRRMNEMIVRETLL